MGNGRGIDGSGLGDGTLVVVGGVGLGNKEGVQEPPGRFQELEPLWLGSGVWRPIVSGVITLSLQVLVGNSGLLCLA